MPFWVCVVWSLTNTRSELLPIVTPSIVCTPDSAMLAPVVATRQGALMATAVSPTTVPRISSVVMRSRLLQTGFELRGGEAGSDGTDLSVRDWTSTRATEESGGRVGAHA